LQEPASTSRMDRLWPNRRRDARSKLAVSSAMEESSVPGLGSVKEGRVKLSKRILRIEPA
jgi:hypothetical protein